MTLKLAHRHLLRYSTYAFGNFYSNVIFLLSHYSAPIMELLDPWDWDQGLRAEMGTSAQHRLAAD